MASVSLKNLTKNYSGGLGNDVIAVRDLSLEIGDREFVVLAGPDGCGKSTILRMIAGLEAVSRGDIFIGDRRSNNVPPKDRDVVLVPGNFAPYPRLSVYENLALGLKLRKFSSAEIKKRVSAGAEALEIGELLEAQANALSGEHRQRLALARAIVRQPKLILFDEPLSDLAVETQRKLRATIAALPGRLQSTTMIYATGDPTEAMAIGDRLVVMNKGVVEQDGTARAVYGTPANLFVAGFFGSPPMNFVDGTLKQDRESLLFTETDDGTIELRFPASAFPGAEDLAGKPLVLGIRPEDVGIAESAGSAPITSDSIPALVDRVEAAGAEAIFYLHTGAHSIISRRPAGVVHPEPGQRLRMKIDPGKAHLFDPISTNRIA